MNSAQDYHNPESYNHASNQADVTAAVQYDTPAHSEVQ